MCRISSCFDAVMERKVESIDSAEVLALLQQLRDAVDEQVQVYRGKVREESVALRVERMASADRRLENGIAILAARCDGARELDEKGFNGPDAFRGHRLCKMIGNWVRGDAEQAFQLLKKYRHTQLPGIDLPDSFEDVAEDYPETASIAPVDSAESPSQYLILQSDGTIGIFCGYDRTDPWAAPDILPTIKAWKGARYTGTSWSVPLAHVESVIEKFEGHFFIPANLYDLRDDMAPEIERRRLESQVVAETEMIRLQALREVEENRLKDAAHLAEKERSLAAELEARRAELENAKQATALAAVKFELETYDFSDLVDGHPLFEHQVAGVEWLLSQLHKGYRGGVLADDMGLGKTRTSMIAATILKRFYGLHVWVIAPVTLHEGWRSEASHHGTEIEVFSWASIPEPLDFSKYIVIADEAHYAQSGEKSSRGEAFLDLTLNENCKAAFVLTGTPLKNGQPANVYPLLQAVDSELTRGPMAKVKFQKRYCAARTKKKGKAIVWDTTGAAHLRELAQHMNPVMLRRTKAECLDLPSKIRISEAVELKPKQLREYNADIQAEIESYQARVEAGEVDPAAEALVTLGILRKIGSKYKIPATIERARELLEQGQKVVIGVEFSDSAREIQRELGGLMLTGETPIDLRQSMIDLFQSDGPDSPKVFVFTIKAGGVGITLTAASNVIIHDRPWTPGDAAQAEDRCHRIGQNSTVTAIWPQLGEIDEMIDALIDEKQQRIDAVLSGANRTKKRMKSIQEIAQHIMKKA